MDVDKMKNDQETCFDLVELLAYTVETLDNLLLDLKLAVRQAEISFTDFMENDTANLNAPI